MNTNKVFDKVALMLREEGFTVIKEDRNRPWGGFFVIEESEAAQFAARFFPDESFEELKISEKLSPKILMVAPGKRLSWQYHHRRAEIWRCVDGEVGVITSETDQEDQSHTLHPGDKIKLRQGERHRLIGLDQWGVVAEIWQHTDASNPSDEDDIVRLQDDFGR
ncbi:MAG: phosphoheptose isomerase [Bacteroidota bacterium]|nr:phosphoheptose isomerase [Bacteroidota bacterium]